MNEPVAYMMESPSAKWFLLEPDECLPNETCTPLYTHPVRELTDEEINKLWAESHEDGIAMQQGFTTQQHYFAHLILKKAGEK